MNPDTQTNSTDIPLIESDSDFFAKTGPLPVHWNCVRKHPRFYCRSQTEAVIFPLKCQPDATPKHCDILTSNISRGGMSVLLVQQLFPGQLIEVKLMNGEFRMLKVAWCRRVGKKCYSAGTQFVV